MDKILNNWNNFLNEQTEPFQKKVKQGYVKDRNQYLKSGKGKPSKPFDVEPSKVRAKSAPPIGESSIEEVYEIDEGVLDSLKNAASNTKSAIKDLGRQAGKVAGGVALGTALAYGGATVKASSDRINTARQTQIDQNIEKTRPTTKHGTMRKDLQDAIMKDIDINSKQGKKQLIQNLIKVFHIDEKAALQILNATSHDQLGGTVGMQGTVNLSNFINVVALAKYDLTMNQGDVESENINLAALKKTAGSLWGDPDAVKKLANQHDIKLTPGSEFTASQTDSMSTVTWNPKKQEESKKNATKENIWTSIDPELLMFEQIEEIYQIDENLWKDLRAKFTKSKQIEKKQEYTNYKEVHNNIYVGAAPLKNGKLINSLIEDGEFIRIFIMSNESANVIMNQYKDVRNIPATIVLKYAVEDTENPTQEEIDNLNKAALLVYGYARQGKVLVTCNKGLNRSATVASLAMTLSGVKPEQAIQKVQAARGEEALTLNGKPHQGFLPIILGSEKTSK